METTGRITGICEQTPMVNFASETAILITDAAARLKVTPKTVRSWAKGVKGKRLETSKLGGLTYTTLEAIQRFSSPSSHDIVAVQAAEQLEERAYKQRHAAARDVLKKYGI